MERSDRVAHGDGVRRGEEEREREGRHRANVLTARAALAPGRTPGKRPSPWIASISRRSASAPVPSGGARPARIGIPREGAAHPWGASKVRCLRIAEEANVKGNPKVIDLLNEVLTNELTGVNQYFLHARMCENWGYERLHEKDRTESIEEMKHADELIRRILYLEGLPNLQRLGKVNVGEDVPEQLRLDLDLERSAIATLNRGIELCRSVGDNGSAELLQDLLEDEDEHASWLEAQLLLLEQVGLQNYLAQQVRGDAG